MAVVDGAAEGAALADSPDTPRSGRDLQSVCALILQHTRPVTGGAGGWSSSTSVGGASAPPGVTPHPWGGRGSYQMTEAPLAQAMLRPHLFKGADGFFNICKQSGEEEWMQMSCSSPEELMVPLQPRL